jgi:hypothetical protein
MDPELPVPFGAATESKRLAADLANAYQEMVSLYRDQNVLSVEDADMRARG